MIKLVLILLLAVSCGTETGNPAKPTEYSGHTPSPSQGDASSYNLEEVLETICGKLASCSNKTLTKTDCKVGVKTNTQFDTEFGLTDGTYADYAAMITAQSNNTLTSKYTESAQCLTDINNLSCSDNEITNAWNSASPNDFSNAHEIVPAGSGSCGDMLN